MKKQLHLTLVALCLLLAAAPLLAQPAGWSRLQPITVTENSGNTLINYQLRVVFDSQTLIASNQMQANGADIRFGKNCNGTVLYNYWIESGLNTTNTVAWVKVDTLLASQAKTIYMYYMNSSAAAVSAVVGTFSGPHSSTDSVASGGAGGATNSQRGFRFTPTQDLLVTHFGKREPNGTTRYITLFDFTTQAILEQLQVSGPAAQYSYGALANPRWLTSGTQYLLQLYQGAADGYYFGTSSQIGQHMTYGDMRYCNSCTQNTFPVSTLSNYHYGYPDMWYFTKQNVTPAPTYTLGNAGQAFQFNAPSSISGSCLIPTYTIGDSAIGGGPFTYLWAPGATLSSTSTGYVVASPTVTTTYTVTVSNAVGCIVIDSVQIIIPPTPTVTATTSATVICEGDSVTLTAGGTDSYGWQPGSLGGGVVTIAPTASTTYTVTGTDNATGCNSTAQVTVNVTPLPVLTLSGNTVLCVGDTTQLTASGATAYSWSSGSTTSTEILNPSATATYTVTGTDNNCSANATITVTVNANPTISIAGQSSLCAGGVVTLLASGASDYTWNNGDTTAAIIVSPVVSQTYTVTAVDSNGCAGAAAYVVTVNLLPNVVITGNNVICAGASTTLTGGNALTYAWSTGGTATTETVTPTATTTYSVVGTDSNGCSGTAFYTVTVNPLPSVTLNAADLTVCVSDGLVQLTGSPASGSYSGPGVSGSTFVPLNAGAGTHTVTYSYTDSNGCSNSAAVIITVDPCVGIAEQVQDGLNVYPNPTNSLLVVETTSAGFNTLQLLDSRGRVVLTTTSTTTRTTLDVQALEAGIYLLQVTTETGVRTTRKVIVQH